MEQDSAFCPLPFLFHVFFFSVFSSRPMISGYIVFFATIEKSQHLLAIIRKSEPLKKYGKVSFVTLWHRMSCKIIILHDQKLMHHPRYQQELPCFLPD